MDLEPGDDIVVGRRRRFWRPGVLNPTLWLDSADASTISEVGGLVNKWYDKSGNTNHVEQVVASKQPSLGWISSGPNSLRAIQFDGYGDELVNASLVRAIPQSMFAVFVEDEQQEGEQWGFLSSYGGWSVFGSLAYAGVGVWNVFSAKYLPATPGRVKFVYTLWNGSLSEISSGGVPTITNIQPAASTGIRIAYSAKCAFGELVLVDRILSDEEIDKMFGYLSWKWGTVGFLPDSHPYKKIPPRI